MPDMSHSSYMFTGFEANCNRNSVRRHLRGCDLTTTSHLCAVHLVHAGMWECLTLSSWHPKASEDLEFRGWRKVNKDLSKFRFARESPLTADCLEGIRPWDLANSSIGDWTICFCCCPFYFSVWGTRFIWIYLLRRAQNIGRQKTRNVEGQGRRNSLRLGPPDSSRAGHRRSILRVSLTLRVC